MTASWIGRWYKGEARFDVGRGIGFRAQKFKIFFTWCGYVTRDFTSCFRGRPRSHVPRHGTLDRPAEKMREIPSRWVHRPWIVKFLQNSNKLCQLANDFCEKSSSHSLANILRAVMHSNPYFVDSSIDDYLLELVNVLLVTVRRQKLLAH